MPALRQEVRIIPELRPDKPGFHRDKGKHFMLTEMSALEASRWAWRMALAVKGTTAQVPPEFVNMGYVGVAIRGINAFLAADVDPNRLLPLLDEMLNCVTRIHDPINAPDIHVPLILEGEMADIQDMVTLEWLRAEVLSMHVGFSVTAAISDLITAVSGTIAAVQTSKEAPTSLQ
jgi:hypothetical protein